VRRSGRPFTVLLILAGLALLCLLGGRLYFGRAAESRIDEEDVVDFAELSPVLKPHRFLMCPAGVCSQPADAESPVYGMEWERLRSYWSEVIAHQPRVKLIGGDGELKKITYIERSSLLHLPQIVTIEFFSVGENGSSFAIESHSRYGLLSTFDDNRALVREWVKLLDKMTAEAPPP